MTCLLLYSGFHGRNREQAVTKVIVRVGPSCGRLAEVFPTPGLKGASPAARIPNDHSASARDSTNPGELRLRDSGGNAPALGDGEQQFVILPAVQSELQIHRAPRPSRSRPGDPIGFDFRAHPAFLADMAEIAGESVAGVDHGGDQFLLAQCSPECNPGWGTNVPATARDTRLVPALHLPESRQ